MDGLRAGTTEMDVSYTFAGQVAHDTIHIDIVGLRIQESPDTRVAYPGVGAPARTNTLHAVGTPLGENTPGP